MENLKNKIKRIIRIYQLRKLGVILKTGVISKNSIFEGKIKIRENTKISNSFIGFGTYIGNECRLDGTKIGRFSSLGREVRVISGNHPTKDYVSTCPFFYSRDKDLMINFENIIEFKEIYKTIDGKYQVSIGNDVWIGENVSILAGTEIGNGAIIGTGSIVRENVPPYSVVVGVPGKIKKYRFSKEKIEILEKFKWWDKDVEWLEKNSKNFSNIDDFIKNIIGENYENN